MTKKTISEISKKLAGRYIERVASTEADRGSRHGEKKAKIQATRAAASAAGWDDDMEVRNAARPLGNAAYDAEKKMDKDHSRKSWNRFRGVDRALKRLTAEGIVESIINEDVASLEETIDAHLRAIIDESLFGPNDPDDDEDDGDDTNEEVEQVDELSVDTMKRYHARSKESEKSLKDGAVGQKFNKNNFNKYINRRNGQEKAVRLTGKKVLAGEEAEQVDELSRSTLSNYIVKAAKDQYRQANMHNIASKSRFKTKRADQLVQNKEYGESDREFEDRKDRVTRRRANLAKTMSDTDRALANRKKGVFTAGKKLIKKDMAGE